VTAVSQPPVKHQRRAIQATCGSWGWGLGRQSKTPSATATIRTSLGGGDLQGHPSTWDLQIVKKAKQSLPLPFPYNQLSKGPWTYCLEVHLHRVSHV